MDRDFRKLTAWIEEALKEGVPEEQKLLEWKLRAKSGSVAIETERSD
jgi:hypothetical protein